MTAHPRPRRPRRGRVIAAGAVATATTAALVGLPGAASATTWAPTATQALGLVNATLLQPAPATRTLHLAIGLKPRNRSALDALVKAEHTPGTAEFGTFLTPDEFTAQYAATDAQVAAVESYLSGQGMTNVQATGNHLLVTADATVAQAEQAFHTSLAEFEQAGRVVLANTTAASVPASLAGTVSAVLGLNSLTLSHPIRTSDVKSPLAGYYPKEFQKVYDATSLRPATSTSIAIITEGDLTQPLKDLRLAESVEGLPQVPVSIVHVGPASPDTSGADEWDLDMQTSTGMAQSVKRLYLYNIASLTDADLARGVNAFAAQDVAKAGSASLGECDTLPYLDGSMLIDDMAFEEAAAQGQTFFASSGDTGSSCAVLPTNGVPGSGLPDTEYPASSTWVTAVGGTTLITDSSDNYTEELAWNAGGGGASPNEYPGWWQANANPSYPALGTVGVGRGVPDIAMDADLTTGANIYVDGTVELIGGTSLSSPMALGAWARMETAHANKVGNASLALYRLYNAVNTSVTSRSAVPGFHDIVLGGNGTYVATPGWDFTTGIGSFDVAALSHVLR